MRVYWYWPFVHPEDLVVPDAVPLDGDSLVLHTMRDRVEPQDLDRGRVQVWPTLAQVGDEREGSLRWVTARSTSYVRRSAQRWRSVRTKDFDVCHVVFLNYFTDWLDLPLLARTTPLVFEIHDVLPHHSRLPRSLEHMLLARQYNSRGHIIVRHDHVRSLLLERFAIDPGRVTVIPWHIPEIDAPPRRFDRDRSTILFFGALRRNKGADVLLRAIELLRDRQDLRFLFAGRGAADVEQQIRDAARRDPRVRFENRYISLEDKYSAYQSADLVALPYTEFSSTSAVLCDAYAHRVPVVASDVGALGRSVRADRSGWTVPPGDPEAFARALLAAVDDRDARRCASDQETLVAHDRTPKCIAEQIREVYARAPERV